MCTECVMSACVTLIKVQGAPGCWVGYVNKGPTLLLVTKHKALLNY